MRPFLATIITPPMIDRPSLPPRETDMIEVLNGPTIAAGESLSDAIDCCAGQLVAITMPSGWSEGQGSKGASLTFQYSPDGETYSEMCTLDGFAVTVPAVVPGSTVVVSADVGRATAWLKLRSGTSGNPVVQEEARTFALSIMVAAAPSMPAEKKAEVKAAVKKKPPAKKPPPKKKGKR